MIPTEPSDPQSPAPPTIQPHRPTPGPPGTGPVQFYQFAGDGVTPLGGVVFTLRAEGGGEVAAISDRTGLVTLPALPPGVYTLSESLAPLGFLLNTVGHRLEILPNGTATIDGEPTVGFSRRMAPGYAFTFTKTAADGVSPMPEVAFELSLRGVPQYAALSGRDGRVRMLAPSPGRYLMREIAAPPGCLCDPTPYPVTILRSGRAYIGDREAHTVVLPCPACAPAR